VRDNLERASDFINKIKIDEENEIESLKKHFKEIKLGMDMTKSVMDATLKRF